MMGYLTRPKDILSKEEKKEIVKDFYKKVEQPKPKSMGIVRYIDTMNRLYGDGGGKVEGTPEQVKGYLDQINNSRKFAGYIEPDQDPKEEIGLRELEDIKKSLPVSELVQKEERFNDKILKRDKYETPKKKIIKKTLIVEKPKPVKPPEWDWRLGDWRDLFDEDTPSQPPADIEKVLNIKKREVAGLEALLSLHKKKI